MGKRHRITAKFLRVVFRFSDRPWFIPLIALFAAADLFVVLIPIDALLIPYVVLRPRKWVTASLTVSLGSALGCVALAWVVENLGGEFTRRMLEEGTRSHTWARVEHLITDYGPWGLGFISFGPLPQHPAVIACAIAKLSPWLIGATVLVARVLKYGILCYLATHGSKLIRRLIPEGFEVAAGPPGTALPTPSSRTTSVEKRP